VVYKHPHLYPPALGGPLASVNERMQ
jgi:hypothetical protein